MVLEIGASNYLRTKESAKYCGKLFGVEFFQERIPPWPILFYLKKYPCVFKKYANFGEVHLFKNE